VGDVPGLGLALGDGLVMVAPWPITPPGTAEDEADGDASAEAESSAPVAMTTPARMIMLPSARAAPRAVDLTFTMLRLLWLAACAA
jgi:hypothetical protein